MKKKLISEAKRAKLKDNLSLNPFYREKDKYLVKSGYYGMELTQHHPSLEHFHDFYI